MFCVTIGDQLSSPLQYYRRNSATEFMGLLYGVYGGRSDGFQLGVSFFELPVLEFASLVYRRCQLWILPSRRCAFRLNPSIII